MAENINAVPALAGKNLIGRRFGKLVVERLAEPKSGRRRWSCRCDCGNVVPVFSTNLLRRPNGSCGCDSKRKISLANSTHGLSKHPIHATWIGMLGRCYTKTNTIYKYYGGRGIEVLEPWKSSFQSFFDDMFPSWAEGLTIERNDSNGPYCKDNCRWATMTEQANNKGDNVAMTLNGKTQTVAQWTREMGFFSEGTIRSRLKRGWSDEDALTKPLDNRGNVKFRNKRVVPEMTID